MTGRGGRGLAVAFTVAGLVLAVSPLLPWYVIFNRRQVGIDTWDGKTVLAVGLVSIAIGLIAAAGVPRVLAFAAVPGVFALFVVWFGARDVMNAESRLGQLGQLGDLPLVGDLFEISLDYGAYVAGAAAVAVAVLGAVGWITQRPQPAAPYGPGAYPPPGPPYQPGAPYQPGPHQSGPHGAHGPGAHGAHGTWPGEGSARRDTEPWP
ncbi:hypothetical protein D5H75_26070 [Bailinhaonella thermotolerans]|uniref:Uncharacterized protein n=1 Tax=Bailinhaonella thermotolerans TaxID=1070861 RepID=A0A3A4AXZ3_9ACTN|nr:hypothetical protein D5H75_26070 [Bailinhaonella thermotolerans]